jgi:hypothetical protein
MEGDYPDYPDSFKQHIGIIFTTDFPDSHRLKICVDLRNLWFIFDLTHLVFISINFTQIYFFLFLYF